MIPPFNGASLRNQVELAQVRMDPRLKQNGIITDLRLS